MGKIEKMSKELDDCVNKTRENLTISDRYFIHLYETYLNDDNKE